MNYKISIYNKPCTRIILCFMSISCKMGSKSFEDGHSPQHPPYEDKPPPEYV